MSHQSRRTRPGRGADPLLDLSPLGGGGEVACDCVGVERNDGGVGLVEARFRVPDTHRVFTAELATSQEGELDSNRPP